ncbi:MAG: VWA domain-containing protein [Solirubrobacteraceae bacterium]
MEAEAVGQAGAVAPANARELTQFKLLARAVAGRPIAVLSGAGERSFTDGESIFVSELPDELLLASVVAQAALLASGSLDPWVMARIAGRRQLRLKYLTLEAVRAAAMLELGLPKRIEQRLAGLYKGGVPRSARQSLEWAARRNVPEAPAWLGTIKPIRVLRATPGLGGAPTDKDLAGQSPEQELRELDDEEESERSKILELFSAPIRNPLANMIQKFFGMGRTPSEGGGGGQELPVGGRSVGPVGPNAREATAPAGFSMQLDAVPIGYRYPEWDFRKQSYKDDYCAVAEFDPPASVEANPPEIDARDYKLRRQLARLGLSHERHRREHEGDVLDLTALIELFVDRAHGQPGDPRVYETKRRTAHDLGVLVLLDATGSTGESAEGRRVFDEQRLLAAKLTAALDELGDRVATYGFYSRGREAVRFLRVKDFDDRYDHAAQRRLQSLTPGGYTRLGAAIRHATFLARERAGTSQMLLVLVGDGLPYEDGYEHRYAQEDSRRALQEAVAQGVGCACVSVRSSTEYDVLERVWGAVPHRRLEESSELAKHVRPLFGDALKAAAATRRRVGPRYALGARLDGAFAGG